MLLETKLQFNIKTSSTEDESKSIKRKHDGKTEHNVISEVISTYTDHFRFENSYTPKEV